MRRRRQREGELCCSPHSSCISLAPRVVSPTTFDSLCSRWLFFWYCLDTLAFCAELREFTLTSTDASGEPSIVKNFRRSSERRVNPFSPGVCVFPEEKGGFFPNVHPGSDHYAYILAWSEGRKGRHPNTRQKFSARQMSRCETLHYSSVLLCTSN